MWKTLAARTTSHLIFPYRILLRERNYSWNNFHPENGWTESFQLKFSSQSFRTFTLKAQINFSAFLTQWIDKLTFLNDKGFFVSHDYCWFPVSHELEIFDRPCPPHLPDIWKTFTVFSAGQKKLMGDHCFSTNSR